MGSRKKKKKKKKKKRKKKKEVKVSSTREPPRPGGLPDDAFWEAADREWQQGRKKGKKHQGEWRFWRPDGTLLNTCSFDDEGRLHGRLLRWHPNGEVSMDAQYEHGKLHGKQVRAIPTRGNTDEAHPFDKNTPKSVVRADVPFDHDEPQFELATYYNAKGAKEPIPTDQDGRSIELGRHADRLVKGSGLLLVDAPFVAADGEEVGHQVEGHYSFQSRRRDGALNIGWVSNFGFPKKWVVAADEVSRRFTLAADYHMTQLARQAQVRACRAEANAARRAKLTRYGDALLEGGQLAAIAKASGDLPARTGEPPVTVKDTERLYGRELPAELRALISLNREYNLSRADWHEFRPFFFEDPAFHDGADAAAVHLRDLGGMYWPIYFECHFAGLYPIGASGAGDYWLARLMPDEKGGSSVWFYDHESFWLKPAHRTISELVYANTLCVGEGFFNVGNEDDALAAFRKRKKGRFAPHESPKVAWERTRWLSLLLKPGGEEKLGPKQYAEELRLRYYDAAKFALWSAEAPLCALWPHIALYWLASHALWDNRDAFDEAFALTARSKSAFVKSWRVLWRDFLSAGELGERTLPGHEPQKFARLIAGMKPSAKKRLMEKATQKRHRS